MLDVQLGRYRLLKLLATGGMGEVFLARHEGPAGFAKTMVVKRMLAHLGRDPNFVEMFLNEARLAARLSHPNVAQIFELGEQDGTYFLAMEFVHGVDLRAIRRHMAERRVEVPANLAAWICAQALKGLHHAHTLTDEQGVPLHIVHRDVSPDNVLVDFNGTVKVVDFGIAKASNSIATTGSGTVKGKFSYMAPELLTGHPATPRTDTYSMGVVLYEFLSGGRPYQGASEGALIHSILEDEPRPLSDLRPGLPAALEEIISRALSKNPQERFRSAETMSVALENFALASGGVSQEGVRELLRGLFGDEPEIVTPTMALRPSSSPSGSARTPSLSSPIRWQSSVRRRLAARPWLWMGVGAALTVAAMGLLLPKLHLSPHPKAQAFSQALPRPQQRPTEVLASALVPPATAPSHEEEEEDTDTETPDTAPPESTTRGPDTEKTGGSAAGTKARRGTSTGTVVLRAASGAEVLYKGRKLGVTPLAPFQLPSGVQTLTLVDRGLGVQKKVRVVVPTRRKVVVRISLNDGQ
ncbi:serine/threonine protein kinase [Hyalangium versicolor]|uniref:serine/threonine protein kinase n=1 Tax=Hyalangium versicolor TaxID=2861190 RepID=UPI001CCB4D00|nr:serine/threonine-protein kinase [Hyalangium versicolor]